MLKLNDLIYTVSLKGFYHISSIPPAVPTKGCNETIVFIYILCIMQIYTLY